MPTILLVDDNKAFREMVATWLKPGYRFLEAPSALKGLVAARKEHPDLILLDLMMPEVSGIDLFRGLRMQPGLESVPVVIVTAYAEMQNTTELECLHPAAVMEKPFSRAQLLDCINSVLTGRSAADRLD